MTDIAVFRPSNGPLVRIRDTGFGEVGRHRGCAGAGGLRRQRDDRDAVYRPSTGRWFVSGTPGSVKWGVTGDVPVPGDYDGDGMTDYAVYRPSTGRWFVSGTAGSVQWGIDGDVPANSFGLPTPAPTP